MNLNNKTDLIHLPSAWTKYCISIMQSLSQCLLSSFFYFNDFLHVNIPLMMGVFLFSYLFVSCLQQNTQKCSAAIVLVNFIRGHVCITTVKTSNFFYLHLLWCKSLFQVFTKCANNYHFLKIMFPFRDPYFLKHLLVNKISVNKVLMRQF